MLPKESGGRGLYVLIGLNLQHLLGGQKQGKEHYI